MSSLEIRPALAEELPEVSRVASRELAMNSAAFEGMSPAWTLCGFMDGRVATTYAAWPLQIRFNGPPVKMAGVTWVSTHPAYRRRGNLRAITRAHFEGLHESRAAAIAGLHPAWAAIYRRYGYGTITERRGYRVEPRNLVFAHRLDVPPGQMREIELEQEFGTLVDVYRRYREPRNALIHRGRAMWDAGPLSPPPANMRQTILVYEENDLPLGYVIYHTGTTGNRESTGPGQVLLVQDLFSLTPSATRAIWGTLASYDAVGEITWNNAPPDDALPNMLVEPRLLNTTVRDGIMARLVDVEDALTLRPYPLESELRFTLIDDTCPWNSGSWLLTTSPAGSRCQRISNTSVDLALGPDTLAQLAWGYLTASQAAHAGLIDLVAPDALSRWDIALRTAFPPHEAEHTW